jgi:hypothetical protein
MFVISKTQREETYAAMFQGVGIAQEFMGLDSSEFYYSSAASDNCDGFYNALKTYNDPKTDLYDLPRKCAIVLLCCLLFYYLLFSAAFITLCWSILPEPHYPQIEESSAILDIRKWHNVIFIASILADRENKKTY